MTRLAPASALLLAALLLLPTPARAGGDLRAATCKRDITPIAPGLAAAYEARFGGPALVNHTDPVFLAGFGTGRAATGYNDRLWARGLVLDGRGGRVAIVSLDLVSYFENEIETIRGLIAPGSGIDFLVVASTHQHEGPDSIGLWGPNDLTTGVDLGYLDFVNAAVAGCVDEAAAKLEKARVRYVTTDSVGLSLGLDREDDGLGVGDGKVLAGDELLAPATEGRIANPRLSVMQVTGRGNPRAVMATLVNFASHPESLGSGNTIITSDFPHYVRERLEREFGGLAIWVSGDLGVLQGPLDIDVLDPATGQPAVRRTFRWAEVHGTQLAERVIDALYVGPRKRLPPGHPAPEISFATDFEIFVQLDNPFFRLLGAIGVLNTRRLLFTDGVPDFDVTTAGIPQRTADDIRTAVGALRIGEASFAIVPTELDPQIGESYRAAMHGAEHTFIVGLGNDHIGYQLPKPKWDDSCHACFVFVLTGNEAQCPIQPVDCNTVFINNVGREVDPTVSDAILPLIRGLHD